MGEIAARIVKAFFDATAGALVDWLQQRRRESALRQLGYGEAQINHLREQNNAYRQAAKIYGRPDPSHIDDTLGRL